MENIRLVLLFSGKRKSGKDFITEQLNKRLGSDRSQIIRISGPVKSMYAECHKLDFTELLSDGPYKEKFRKEMIEWSDSERAKDYGFFCRKAVEEVNREIVIVSDIRRKNDIKFFKETFGNRIRTIKIYCPENVRSKRGWIFKVGVDDVQSECDLDDVVEWDLVVNNDETENIDTILEELLNKTNEWIDKKNA